ncbi:ATP-binding protein [Fusibacter sp. JL216-2]|uniref:ATP-binding protein n=1 Tax=Fusibacter sp. JL216-2 TaxID=3071453 RepID=UPI003D341ED8
MNFIINEFSIISPIEKKAFNHSFDRKINLVVGEKDAGKSTLARSMMYTLGCEVKDFEFQNEHASNIYIMDFNIENDNYILIRRKLKIGRGSNFFKIIKNRDNTYDFYDTKTFTEFLNEIMGIEVVTMGIDKKETQLYPNHIFLPFYTDQDNSWQDYMDSTFNGIKFIKNHRKVVLEYFTGARPNEYYRLNLKKSKLKISLDEFEALIKSKELIIDENNRNIHIVENIDIDTFKEQYKYFLDTYNNIIETEHKLKKELNDKMYKRNTYSEMKSSIELSINDMIENELNSKCPNCKQVISKSLEENYVLYLTKENLINEREKVNMFLHDLEEDIEVRLNEVSELKYIDSEIKAKLDSTSELIDLANRADSYALSRVNMKLKAEIDSLRIKRDRKKDELEAVEKSLLKLNNKDVSKTYKELMIDSYKKLNIPFSYKNYYTSNLESVKINLSGATKVQAILAQYLTIYEMACNTRGIIKIPMFIDTYRKDDFNEPELDRTAKFIFDTLKSKHQAFVFMSNNEQNIDSIKGYNYSRLDLSTTDRVLNQDSDLIMRKYYDYISSAQ